MGQVSRKLKHIANVITNHSFVENDSHNQSFTFFFLLLLTLLVSKQPLSCRGDAIIPGILRFHKKRFKLPLHNTSRYA